ncbi:hypothetical protein CMO83_02140 [Candidatus Woesearchaeota archaeon]|jgi:hypothetical protein|nr:hypothetical protein [Candidatus Woesearchaeota archaeon]|tara:strand:+ start:918 stop:1211 length:294 start_codon:yes stop_codon:yes gene_type:complete
MEKNTPEKKFSTGAITATVWQNIGKNRTTGEPVEYRTVSFQRRYKDKDGNWQSTSSLRVNDLPRANVVIQKAFEYLVLRENVNDTDAIMETPIEEVI